MRFIWIGVLVGGCAQGQVEELQAPQAGVPQWGPSDVYDEDGQCRDLLSPVADTLTDRAGGQPYASFPLETVSGEALTITAAGLSRVGGSMLGQELKSGTNGVSVKITGLGSDEFGATYQVKYKTATDPTWRDYCPPNEAATASRGEWKASAFRIPTNRVTFGCDGSAMKKCYSFGYPAPANDVLLNLGKWRAHQACTRMARADICGNGTSGTRPKTPIVIRDLYPGHNPEPVPPAGSGIEPLHQAPDPAPPDEHYYEAAWSYKEDWGAVCLARDRWRSIGTMSCPNLNDPSDHDEEDASFCDELTEDALRAKGAWTVNASKTQDRFLKLWRNPTTGDVVTTTRGFLRNGQAAPPPFEGYTEFLGFDGILLRNPPYSLTPADVVPVYSTLLGTKDRVLLPNPALTPAHWSFEGYMIKPRPGEGMVPFKRLTRRNPDGSIDTITSIGRPASEGWTEVADPTLELVLAVPNKDL